MHMYRRRKVAYREMGYAVRELGGAIIIPA